MVLADRKDDGLADFAADRVAQGVFQKGLAEELVGGIGKETLLELALLEGLLLIFAASSVKETTKPSSESSSVVISVRASTTVGLIR